jgi:hypothetical protein
MANITAILEAIQKKRSFGEKLADKMGGEPLLKDPEAKTEQENMPVSKTFEQKASQDIQNFRDKVEDGENLQKKPVSEKQRAFMAVAAQGKIPGVSKQVGQEFMAEDKGGQLPERAEKTHPMPVPLRDSAALPQSMEKGINEYSDEALSAAKMTSASKYVPPEMKHKYTKAIVTGKNDRMELKGKLGATEQKLVDATRNMGKLLHTKGTGAPGWEQHPARRSLERQLSRDETGDIVGKDLSHPIKAKLLYDQRIDSPEPIADRYMKHATSAVIHSPANSNVAGSVELFHKSNEQGTAMSDNLNKSVIGKLKAMVPLASLACGAGGCGSKVEQSGDYQKTSVEGGGPVKTECYRNHQQVPCGSTETPPRPTLQGTPVPTPTPVQKTDASDMQGDLQSAKFNNSVMPPASPNVPALNTNPNTQPAPAPTPTFDQNLSASAFGSAPAKMEKALGYKGKEYDDAMFNVRLRQKFDGHPEPEVWEDPREGVSYSYAKDGSTLYSMRGGLPGKTQGLPAGGHQPGDVLMHSVGATPAGLQKASPSKIHEDKSIKEANGTQEAADVKAGPLNATKLKAIISAHKEMTARLNQNFNPSVARGVAYKEEYIDRAKAQEKSGTGAVYSGENSGKSPEARSEQLHEKKEKMNPQIIEPKTKDLKKGFDENYYNGLQSKLANPGQMTREQEFMHKIGEIHRTLRQSNMDMARVAPEAIASQVKRPTQPVVADDETVPSPHSKLPEDFRAKAESLQHSADFPPTGMSKIHHIINKVKGSSSEPMEKGVRESVNNFVAPKPDSKPGMVTDARHALTTPIGSGADQLIDRRPKTAMALAALAAGNIVGANAAAWNHLKSGMYEERAAIQNSANDYQKEQYDAQMNKKIQPQKIQKSVSSLQKAKEMLAGGKADGIPNSAFDQRSLRQGQKIEQEHTSNPKTALEIAKDHLAEHGSQYYPKLKQMEGSMEKASDTPEVKREGKDNSKVVGKVVLGEKGEWHWAKEGEEGIPVRKQHGYYRVTGGEYRGRYLHSIVAEKKMGRKLKDGEEVDHMNGDRSDTKNLKVLSIGEHTSKTNKTRGDEGSGPKKYAHSKDDNHKKVIEKSDGHGSAAPAAPVNVVMGVRG